MTNHVSGLHPIALSCKAVSLNDAYRQFEQQARQWYGEDRWDTGLYEVVVTFAATGTPDDEVPHTPPIPRVYGFRVEGVAGPRPVASTALREGVRDGLYIPPTEQAGS